VGSWTQSVVEHPQKYPYEWISIILATIHLI
jgi:hypothetical protein